MGINGISSSNNIFQVNEIAFEQTRRTYSSIEKQVTPSGDTVDISDEAKRLYSEMIHRYDKASAAEGRDAGKDSGTGQQSADEKAADESAANGGAAGGGAAAAGGSDSESTATEVEKIKKQIQALKSQLQALASQAQAGNMNPGTMEKMSSLQAQIAALESQLNAMQAANA